MTLYDQWVQKDGRGSSNYKMALSVVAGILLLILSARITVPFYPVPMSMQSLVAIGLGLAIGPIQGAFIILSYLAMGAIGLPVFAGTPHLGVGVPYMLGPTGGYLIGFVLAAFVAGVFARKGLTNSVPATMIAALVAGTVIYVPGLLWLGGYVGYGDKLLSAGLYPFIPGDIAKALIASIIFPAIGWLLE